VSDRLCIGLLQCGYIDPSLIAEFGDYPEVFADLFAPFALDLVTYDVQAGQVPSDPGACDGWLVSGSASSAYEPLAWIPPLEAFLRTLIEQETPLVAICFGHQLLAQAMGGRVERAPEGWGVGVHEYQVLSSPASGEAWSPSTGGADRVGSTVRLIASHQDQVAGLPDRAEVVARTEHCKVAAYTLGPKALAIQPHPEFTPGLSARLMELRRSRIGDDVVDAALASLDQPLDRHLVAAWIDDVWRS